VRQVAEPTQILVLTLWRRQIERRLETDGRGNRFVDQRVE
jgi:hypothetical protein